MKIPLFQKVIFKKNYEKTKQVKNKLKKIKKMKSFL